MCICQYRLGYAAGQKGQPLSGLKKNKQTKLHCSLKLHVHTGRQGCLFTKATQETKLMRQPPVCPIRGKEREGGKPRWLLNLTPGGMHETFAHISLAKTSHHTNPRRSTEAGKCEPATCLKVGRTRTICLRCN